METTIQQLTQLVEMMEIRLGDVQTDLAELHDLMGLNIAMKRAFQRNRQLVEKLVVDAFELESAKQLIMPSKRSMLPAVQQGLPGKERRINILVGQTDLPLDSRIRRAQVAMYYLMIKHDTYASYRSMQGVFGFNPKWMFPTLKRLAAEEEGFVELLTQIERRFLDAMGLLDQPVLPIPATLVYASTHKQECKRLNIPYRYADYLTINE